MYAPCVYKYRYMHVCICVYELLHLCIISTFRLSILHLYIYLPRLLIHLSAYILLISSYRATLFFCFWKQTLLHRQFLFVDVCMKRLQNISQQLICAAYHLCLKQALGQAIQVCFLVRLSFSHGDVAPTAQHPLWVAQVPEGTVGKVWSPLDTSLEDAWAPIGGTHSLQPFPTWVRRRKVLAYSQRTRLSCLLVRSFRSFCLVRDFLPELLSTNGRF